MVILASAYGAACAAAGASMGLFLSLAYAVEMLVDTTAGAFGHLVLLAVAAIGLIAIGGLWGMIWGGALIAVFALPTSILLILCSERANSQRWWVYGICGAANGFVLCVIYSLVVDPIITPHTPGADIKLFAVIAMASAGGLLAGLVYRAVASNQ